VQKFYVKRPGRSGVEEGDMELAGGSDSIQSMTKSGMNAYLAASACRLPLTERV
jgi:hypothetical protein